MKKYLLFAVFFFFLFCYCPFNGQSQGNRMPPPLKAVFVNGDSLHYIDVGKGDPVVFVHGSLSDYRTWGLQIEAFAKNHRVISYSRRYAFPNRQVFDSTADYSVVQHAKDLAEFLKQLQLGPVHLVGHSYGAFTALLTTMEHPELVRSLTLGEPPVMSLLQRVPGGDTLLNNFFSKSIIPAGQDFNAGNEIEAVKVFVGGVMGDDQFFSKVPEPGRTVMLSNTLEVRGFILTKSGFPDLSCETIRKISTPVLLIKGDRSPAVLASIIDEMDKCLVNKEKKVLPNSSHGLEFENPVAFNKIVLDFINKN